MTLRKALWLRTGAIAIIAACAIVVALPGGPSIRIGSSQRSTDLHLGLDLQGGTHLVYDADVSGIGDSDRSDALDSVRDVIERRVNLFGVSEPVVQTNRVGDAWRVIVDLPGVKDVKQAIQLIGETPLLEFREQAPATEPTAEETAAEEEQKAEIKTRAESVLQRALAGEDFAALANEFSEDPGNTSQDGAKNGGDLGFATRGTFVAAFDTALFDQLNDGDVTPSLVESPFGYHIIKRLESRTQDVNGTSTEEVHGAHILFALPSDTATTDYVDTGLSGKQLKRALVEFDPTNSAPVVSLQFNDEGKQLFADITKRNIGKPVAIYLDGSPISIPTVQQEITGGTAIISGDFTLPDAKDLAKRLNAGALPVPITLATQQTIGPTLGRASIDRSLFAGLLGLFLVAVFMLIFYRLPGLLATVALVIYAAIVLAIFKLWPVTLTLAGVAGFILSIGIAVDANVLIFERTKEELRAGRPLFAALEEGFSRAWLSIRDSNVSGLITTVILAWFGTGPIKGFAITLAIGILVSMFTAITVSRTFLRLVYEIPALRRTWLFGVSQPERGEETS